MEKSNFKIVNFYKQSFDFQSKTGVAEYWLTILWVVLITLPVLFVLLFSGAAWLLPTIQIINTVPNIALLSRRLNDVGLPPLYVIPLLFICLGLSIHINVILYFIFSIGTLVLVSLKTDTFIEKDENDFDDNEKDEDNFDDDKKNEDNLSA